MFLLYKISLPKIWNEHLYNLTPNFQHFFSKSTNSMSEKKTSTHVEIIESNAVHHPPPISKPCPIQTVGELKHSPGWRSWLDKDNFAFLILGILVGIP